MNPLNGDIHYGDAEVLDRIGKQIGKELVPIPEDIIETVESFNTAQRKNWAKQERKRQRRLKELARAKR